MSSHIDKIEKIAEVIKSDRNEREYNFLHNVNNPENVTVCMIGFTIPKDEEKEKFNQKIKEFELDKI